MVNAACQRLKGSAAQAVGTSVPTNVRQRVELIGDFWDGLLCCSSETLSEVERKLYANR